MMLDVLRNSLALIKPAACTIQLLMLIDIKSNAMNLNGSIHLTNAALKLSTEKYLHHKHLH